MTYEFVHVSQAFNKKKKKSVLSARMCCENAQINLIWG